MKIILPLLLFAFLSLSCGINKTPELYFVFGLSRDSGSSVPSAPSSNGNSGAISVPNPISNPTTANSSYSVGGTVTGLTGSSLTIVLNSTEQLTITTDGSFFFATKLNSQSSFTISISVLPVGKFCSIQNETGTILADISNVLINCQDGSANGPLVGGTIFNPLNLSYEVTTLGVGGSFNAINGISTDGRYIYTANAGNHTVNIYDPATSTYTLLAGQAGAFGNIDAIGSIARFHDPDGVVYLNGYLYVTDTTNGSIRKIDLANNSVTTIATGLISPYGITSDGSFLYVTVQHEVKKISLSTFAVTSLAGNVLGYSDGNGASAAFNITATTGSITYDGSNLYIVDNANCAIRKITLAGDVTTIIGSPPPTVSCLSVDGVGTSTARIASVDGIASDGTNLYLSETGTCLIRKVTMSSLTLSTIVGLSGSCSLLDGNGTAARVKNPAMITSDGIRLYIAEWGSNALRKVE